MPLSFRRSLPITGVAVVMTGALALAQTHATPAPRVRPETRQAADLLNDLIAQSRTGRELVDMLNDSDILAYVRHRRFTTTTLDGRIGFVPIGRADANGDHRDRMRTVVARSAGYAGARTAARGGNRRLAGGRRSAFDGHLLQSDRSPDFRTVGRRYVRN